MQRNTLTEIQNLVDKNGIIFLTYGGFLTQTLISGITETLEYEADCHDLNSGLASNIFTIFIELAQNMMNYSKSIEDENSKTEGIIVVGKKSDTVFYIDSQNIVSKNDKNIVDKVLTEIKSLNKDEIKKKYRELRRSGRGKHSKGAGIGFYEIAKRCSSFSHKFIKLDEDIYIFYFEANISYAKKEV